MPGAGMIALRSERIVTAGGVLAGELRVAGGRIAAIGARPARDQVETIELGEHWLVPGFIDTHVHGGGGAQLHSSDPDELAAARRFHAAHGTTALLATTVSAPLAELRAVLAALARAAEPLAGGAAILGVHLEGPFVNPARAGAMDPATFLDPDRARLAELLAAAGGGVRMVTLAPELPGGLELIGALRRAGVVASIGHTDASYEQVGAAARAGARSVTHLYNAMRGLHHRAPGAVGAALELDGLQAELIGDGEHVSAPAARLALRSKGDRGLRLITDAVAAAGMPEGRYRLGATRIELAGSRAVLPATGTLAGSTLTMDAAVRWAVQALGLSPARALALASANPARLLGIGHRKGALAQAMDADLVVLDDELEVAGVMVAGAWVLDLEL